MAASNGQPARDRPIAIAPAPVSHSTSVEDESSPMKLMAYSCQNCAKRKVRCDKRTPICSSCRKAKLGCFYQAPPPRRKRKADEDLNEKVAKYEQILRQHDLLPQDDSTSPPASTGEAPGSIWSTQSDKQHEGTTGRLLARNGVMRYITSNPWHSLEEETMQYYLSEDEEDDEDSGSNKLMTQDPLTGAFMGSYQNLLPYHPSAAEALVMWKAHVENVEPMCKILHIPTVTQLINITSQQPEIASKVDECLLFAIYHFAVHSMTDQECLEKLETSRKTLSERYMFAARQALVNANFLKSEDITILQAFVLFLLACRYFYHPNTYWLLTGVAVRMSHRLGVHRDGEELGLAPFDVEMRRRLFYQVLPLDGIAGRLSGTGMVMQPNMWSSKQPTNVNDDQIWPGMTSKPQEQEGATELIFCLVRSSMGRSLIKVGLPMHHVDEYQPKDMREADQRITEAEAEVEAKYIRYCDVVNPLHFLSMGFARSAATAMRIRIRIPKAKSHTLNDEERKELFQLCLKVIDTDSAIHDHSGLKRFQWQLGPFFAWGSWEAIVFILTTLRQSLCTTIAEKDNAWKKVESMYNNHNEFLVPKRPLQIAIGRLTLSAWNANPPSISASEPTFITTLRSASKVTRSKPPPSHSSEMDAMQSSVTPPTSIEDEATMFRDLGNEAHVNAELDFNLDNTDWLFWDKLVRDYETQRDQ